MSLLRWAPLLCFGCAPEGPLVSLDGWQTTEPAADPWSDAPPDAGCDLLAWGPEEGVLEVETDLCSYFAVSQPLLRDLRNGAVITVDLWNLGTWAPEPADAHVAVQIGLDPTNRWETLVPIPSPGAVWDARIPLEGRVRAGDPVFLHLHNHGANSWRFAEPGLE